MHKKTKCILVFIVAAFVIICILWSVIREKPVHLAPGNEWFLGSGSGILIIYHNEDLAGDEEYWNSINLLKEANFMEARQSLEAQLMQIEPHTQLSKKATLQNLLGMVSTFEWKFEEANDLFTEALECFEGSEEEKRAFGAAVNNNLGHMYYWFGPIEKIEAYYENALKLADRKEDQLVICSNALAAELLTRPSDVTRPQYMEIIKKGKNILKEEKNFYGSYQIAGRWVLSTISNTYSNMNNFKQSEKMLERALDLIPYEGNHEIEKAGIYRDQGIIYEAMGNFSEAEKKSKLALEIRQRIFGDENIQTSDLYSGLGSAYGSNGDYETALIYLKKALIGAKENTVSAVILYNNLGVCYGLLHEMENSKYWLIKSYLTSCNINGKEKASKETLRSYYNTVGDYEMNFEQWLEAELDNFIDEVPIE